MIRVFISYRQSDREVRQAIKRIYDYMCYALDEDFVMYDQAPRMKTKPINELPNEVSDSDVLIALIGKDWMNLLEDKQNKPNETDWVFQEIYTGLTTDGVLVIPVTMNDASFPPPTMLPDQIKSLGYKRGMVIRDNSEHFEEDLYALVERIKLRHTRFGGTVQVYDELPEEVLRRMVSKARKMVRYMGIWTAEFGAALQEPIIEAIERGAEVQLLMLDPDNPSAIQRSRDLGRPDNWTSKRILDHVEHIRDIVGALKQRKLNVSRLKLKLYNAIPSRVVYVADETALIGSHPVKQLSRNAPYILVYGQESGLFRNMKQHFDNLWESEFSQEQDLLG